MAAPPLPSQSRPHPKSPVRIDVIIVGAGLAGLAAAISIAQSGHAVTVFEAAKQLSEIGAGLQLTPNCTRILQQWNLSARLWASGAEPTSLTVHRCTGKVLAQEDDFNKNIRAKYGAPFLDMHRIDLQQALYERACELGVQFRMNQRVQSIDFYLDRPELTTESGTQAQADLIVAGDGLWSACRSSFLGKTLPPLPTGDLAYRIVLRLDQIDSEDLRDWVKNPTCHFWIGPGAHAVGYSLRNGDMYNIVLLVPDNLPPGVRRQSGSVEEMEALFHGWDPILSRFLSLVSEVDKWKLMHRRAVDVLDAWVNDKSNFVMIGDSCHPMLPYLAQGANSAIEDGAVLGLLLGFMKSKAQLPKALKLYEKLRKARGDAIVKETFKQRTDFHMPDGPEQEKRDELFLSQLGKEVEVPFPSRWTCPQVQPWLYGYDAYGEVQDVIEREKPFEEAQPEKSPTASACSATASKQMAGEKQRQ
ncbi:FAD binding domain-containing protein, partial [Apiospora kogelbergensis]|uniref:FAD binding domain-containing protein n=1 Tax=Apiospora kogelbergensis TaxID=1337665 RepID=UPI00312DA4AE